MHYFNLKEEIINEKKTIWTEMEALKICKVYRYTPLLIQCSEGPLQHCS